MSMLEKLGEKAVRHGMKHLPKDAPYDVQIAVREVLQAAVGWLLGEAKGMMKPEAIKVKVKKGAKATATVEK